MPRLRIEIILALRYLRKIKCECIYATVMLTLNIIVDKAHVKFTLGNRFNFLEITHI